MRSTEREHTVDEPLTIALMIESDGPGGAERMVLQLADELRSRGHSIVPVGPDDGCGWLAEQFRRRGFQPDTFSLRRPVDGSCLAGLVRLLRERQVDVVHGHEFTMAVYGAASARLLRRPNVITMHGGRGFAAKLRRRMAVRWAARRGMLVTVSESTRDFLAEVLGLPPSSVTVVPNGISVSPGQRDPVRRELGLTEGESLLLAVGNLYPVKGHAVLLHALKQLAARSPELHWRAAIAGRGQERDELERLLVREGMEERCHLLGYRDDIGDLLAAADLYVMPSLSEGLPIALLEAMFAGKPIVASNVGGIPEAVGSDDAALLVNAGDPAGLAEGIGRVLRNPVLARELGARARDRAREVYGARRMADRYEEAYYKLLRGR